MTVTARAWRSVTRRPRRSALLFSLIAVISALLLAQHTTVTALWHLSSSIQQGLGAGFSVTSTPQVPSAASADGTPEPAATTAAHGNSPGHPQLPALTGESTAPFSRIPGVIDTQLEASVPAALSGATAAPLGGITLTAGAEVQVSVLGSTASSLLPDFASHVATVTEGTHLSSPEEAGVLVHRSFASANGWKIGDTLTLRATTPAGHDVTTTIRGIYEAVNSQPISDPSQAVEHRIITGIQTAHTLAGDASLSAARYRVDTAEHLEQALLQARQLAADTFPQGNVTVSDNAASLAPLISATEGARASLQSLLLVAVGASLFTLIFILVFWVRSRVKEIGILLACGMSKPAVTAQFLLEITLLALPAFACALIGVGASIPLIDSFLLSHLSGDTSGAAQAFTGSSLDDLFHAGLGVSALMSALLLISTLCAVFTVMRRPTRQILTTLS